MTQVCQILQHGSLKSKNLSWMCSELDVITVERHSDAMLLPLKMEESGLHKPLVKEMNSPLELLQRNVALLILCF